MKTKRSILVSFSGLDGSGKTTQIENLRAVLEQRGYRTHLLAFWDNVVVLTRYREGFVHKMYGSERGIGAPGKPVERRDKNVRRWYLSLARHALYFLDALHLRWVLAQARRRSGADVIILDRYVYDEWANLSLRNPLSRLYIHAVNLLIPRPDVAYLLDADPVAARARKPEYPVDFMEKCRVAYKQLAMMLGTMTLVPAVDLPLAKQHVTSAFWLAAGKPAGLATEDPEKLDAEDPQKVDAEAAA
jgi:thymidylate kinase